MRSTMLRQPRNSRWLGAGFLVATALIAACNPSDTSFIGAAAAVHVAGPDSLEGLVANDLGPFAVKVVDTAGTGVPGVTVNFTISGPATLVTTTAQTNQEGGAFTSIQFGNLVGLATITATVAGISAPAVFHANSLAANATSFTIAGVQNQTAVRGTVAGEPLSVLVADQYGNPVSGILVTWTAPTGVLVVNQPRSGKDGRVTASYQLPATPGAQIITATATVDGVAKVLTFTITGS